MLTKKKKTREIKKKKKMNTVQVVGLKMRIDFITSHEIRSQ